MRVNPTQALVLGLFIFAWAGLVAILVTTPEIYDASLHVPSGSRATELEFLSGLSAFLVLLAIGVVGRWRWAFWLILVAFVAGVLRVPAAIFQFAGLIGHTGPTWYVLFQMVLGLVQFAIGVAMVASYRRGGIWASL